MKHVLSARGMKRHKLERMNFADTQIRAACQEKRYIFYALVSHC